MDSTLIKIKSFFDLLLKGYVTPKKVINLALVRTSLMLKAPKVFGLPYSLSIEPTNCCNLKCPLCPTGMGRLGRDKSFLTIDAYKKVMNEMSPYLFNVLLTVWGEPFLHKDIFGMITYAKKRKVKVTLMTNGHFFDSDEVVKKLVESKADRILLDLDGADQETLVKYRVNGDFDKIVRGIKRLVAEKEKRNSKYPIIELQFIVMKHNEHQLEKIKQLAKEWKVDCLVLKTVRVNTEEEARQFLPSFKEARRYGAGINRDKEITNDCDALWTSGLIYADGGVSPCCFDFAGSLNFGNIKTDSFRNIWKSGKFAGFRKSIITNKKAIPLCSNCPGGDENFDIEKINFIN